MSLWSSLKPPRPKEHGAWGMLYVPFLVAAGITGTFDLKMVLLLFAVTLIFLSQQPLALTKRNSNFSSSTLRASRAWLGVYWILSAILFVILYSRYHLFDLRWFALTGSLVAAFSVYFIRKNRVRSVPGEFVGILGLTMTGAFGSLHSSRANSAHWHRPLVP